MLISMIDYKIYPLLLEKEKFNYYSLLFNSVMATSYFAIHQYIESIRGSIVYELKLIKKYSKISFLETCLH